jgi:hypothetical protein
MSASFVAIVGLPRINRLPNPLVIALLVKVRHVLGKGATQGSLPDEHHLLKASIRFSAWRNSMTHN